jgi:hypothetical protein
VEWWQVPDLNSEFRCLEKLVLMSFNINSDEVFHQPDGNHAAEHDQQVEADNVASDVLSGDGSPFNNLNGTSLALSLGIRQESGISSSLDCLSIPISILVVGDILYLASFVSAGLWQDITVNRNGANLLSKTFGFEVLRDLALEFVLEAVQLALWVHAGNIYVVCFLALQWAGDVGVESHILVLDTEVDNIVQKRAFWASQGQGICNSQVLLAANEGVLTQVSDTDL